MSELNSLISDARELLNKAEKAVEPEIKTNLVASALEKFDECKESDPSQKENELIANIRKSFARTVVDQIQYMNFENPETLQYFIYACIMFGNETCEFLKTDDNFNTKFKWIRDQYSEELNQVFSRIGSKTSVH